MAVRETSGLQQNQILKRTRVYRDVRPFTQRMFEEYAQPASCVSAGFMALGLMFIYPILTDALLIVLAVQGIFTWRRYSDGSLRLPMRMPRWSDFKIDRASRKASQKTKFKGAEGIFYIGRGVDPGMDFELWLDQKDMGTHTLILGCTGAGKTVFMQGLAYSFLAVGGGVIYVDPKASPSLCFEFFLICRRLGRDCDLRILNFAKDKLTSSTQKSITIKPEKTSNTMNPLAMGTATDITTILCSLLPKDDGGSNAVFRQKGILLIQTIIPLLVKLRDLRKIELSVGILNHYLDPDNSVGLVYPKSPKEKAMNDDFQGQISATMLQKRKQMAVAGQKPTKEEEKGWRKKLIQMYVDQFTKEDGSCSLPDFIRYQADFEAQEVDDMRRMLKSVNFIEEKPLYGENGDTSGKVGQAQSFFDQYGYGRAYFSQSMATMSQDFGFIFNAVEGEVDIFDCIFNNRVMITNIPSINLSPDETATIGKIVLAQIRSGIAYGIPARLEGSSANILEASVSVARAPIGLFVDEYAAISCPGFAVVCTQARSLGFCAIIGTQDIPGLEKADKNEAGMIIGNTSVKYFMRLKDPNDTFQLANKQFGEAYVQKKNMEDLDAKDGQVEKTSKVSFEDLNEQNEGEFHCSFDDQLIRGVCPYMVPDTKGSQLRFVRGVILGLPDVDLIKAIASLQERSASRLGIAV